MKMISRASGLGVGLLASVLGACAERTQAPPQTGAAPTEAAESSEPSSAAGGATQPAPGAASPARQQTPTPKAYMQEHFAEAATMRRAALAGQLEPLRAAASGLAGDEWTPNLRPDWKPHVAEVRAAARAANTAANLDDATQALGALGEACASCHRSVGGPPAALAVITPPKDEERPMLEHAGAEEQLWRGLAFPSDAAWASGLDALENAPALDSDVAEVAAVARRLTDWVKRAEAPGAARGKLYGQIVTTCASCHDLVEVELKL